MPLLKQSYPSIFLSFRYLPLTIVLLLIVSPLAFSQTTIYSNGDIITMADKTQASYVEAIAVENGNIVFTGTKGQALTNYPNADLFDLDGQTLIPGFVDIHSHFSQTATKLGVVPLDPAPAGDITSIKDIVTKLSNQLKNSAAKYQTPRNG